MARINFPDPTRVEVEGMLRRLPVPLNLARMAAHAPAVGAVTLDMGTTMLTRLSLPPRRREIVVLQVARDTQCTYVWGQHATIGLAAGLTEAEIAAIAVGRDEWTDPAEQTLSEAVAELLADDRISEPVWRRLIATFPHEHIVELCLVTGYYRMLAGFLNSFDVDVDPKGPLVVEATAASNGY